MALYSGHDESYADLIAAGIQIEKYMNILDQIAGPAIGEVRFTVNNTRPVLAYTNGNLSMATIKSKYTKHFDGWVYANGAIISKSDFPEAYEFFHSSSYPNKADTGDSITIPNICKFIKLNVDTGSAPISDGAAQYATPNHVHYLGAVINSSSANKTVTVPHAAWIWSTNVDTSRTGGKMPSVDFDDGQGHVVHIPEAPSAHKGQQSFHHYVNWDVPVDINLNTSPQEFRSTTSNMIQATVSLNGLHDLYHPNHVSLPAIIYIGRKNLS